VVKVALLIFLSVWIANRADIRRFWRGFVPAVCAIGVSVGVVGIEDFGTAALLAAVGGVMLIAGGAKWRHIFLLVLPAVPAFGYLLVSRAHRLERLVTFLDIWRDPEGKGYQAIQSLCTIASGGWLGRGLGNGFVKGYLPAARTDFIFSVICEELGIVGAVAVIGLLIALIWNGRAAFLGCADPMGRLLAFGITMTIGLQAAMNVAVVTVSVPTKGIALPLVSAGGSGAIVMGGLVGILANIPRLSGASAGKGT
jgi:cell division protein FtsW